jgi:ATP-dependent DNA helicase RecG
VFAPLSSLKGIGDKVEKLFGVLLNRPNPRIIDLLLHLPTGVIDRRASPKLIDVVHEQLVTITIFVVSHRPPQAGRNRAPYKIYVQDETADLTLVWFNGYRSQLEKLLPVGETRVISGRVELFDGHWQMVHPDRVCTIEEAANLPGLEPIYPATGGLAQGVIRRMARQALTRAKSLPFHQAIEALHNPLDTKAFELDSDEHKLLSAAELLASQTVLALVRANYKRKVGRETKGTGEQTTALLNKLPYTLTTAQNKAIAEISKDMASPMRMLRLLQGDVGAGKTVVALMAMLQAVETGRQAALMAPTEILAKQHYDSFNKLGIECLLLTGNIKGKERQETLAKIANGVVKIIIGTHALFQEAVIFHDLALAIIDEQHRFGVQQRLMLAEKGDKTDTLFMTATPIPRTLVMTWFGDMDVSRLDEKPPGRQPIDTRLFNMERLPEIIAGLRRKLDTGAQIYWVCPLVSESEELDLTAAIERHIEFQMIFGEDIVGLLHGQMKGADKDEVMVRFKNNTLKILVATTVIEVGVDVPNASVMVIEQAERFGLSQLHQLRGRVGRGANASSCLLLYKAPLGITARDRLETMRASEDGFYIAEKDLELRGQGEVLGSKQSGDPAFKVATPELVASLLPKARDEAKYIIAIDPELKTERGEQIRDLLYIFGKDEAVKLISA